MSETLELVRALVKQDNFRDSLHAVHELVDDGLLIEPIIRDISTAMVVGDYPDYHKDRRFWFFNSTKLVSPFIWSGGVPKGQKEPAVLVTAYRPDPQRWDASSTRRRQR